MKTNHSYTELNKINLRSVLLDYVFSLIFNVSLKQQRGDQQNYYYEDSDEDEKIIITSNEELRKTELPDSKSKNEFGESKYYIRTAQNGYKLIKVNIFQKREIKHIIVYPKINREEEINLENPTDFDSSSVLGKIKNSQINKSHNPSGKLVLNEDEGDKCINYSDKESQNNFVADNIDFESFLEGAQEIDISEQDSDSIFSNINTDNKPKKGGNKKEYLIKTESNSNSILVQLKYKKSFKFHPKLYKLIFTNSHNSPSIFLRTLTPRTVVKRSSPSASTRQLESPTEGNFPVSIAGSSLYGTYAYAHTRPSGFGIFPTIGGEDGENEGGEIVGGDEGN